MRPIDDSRKAFLPAEKPSVSKPNLPPAQNRSFPFNVVSPTSAAGAAASPARVQINPTPKPKLVDPPTSFEKKLDTNKLPPIPLPEVSFEEPRTVESFDTGPEIKSTELSHINRIRIKAEARP